MWQEHPVILPSGEVRVRWERVEWREHVQHFPGLDDGADDNDRGHRRHYCWSNLVVGLLLLSLLGVRPLEHHLLGGGGHH